MLHNNVIKCVYFHTQNKNKKSELGNIKKFNDLRHFQFKFEYEKKSLIFAFFLLTLYHYR